MGKLSMTRFRPVKFRMGQVHLKKGGLSCKGATKAADLSQPDICCGPEPDMCCKICSRDQSFQDNYRKWVELRAKSSGTPDVKYRVPPRYGTCCEAGYTKADFHCVAKCEDCSIPIFALNANEDPWTCSGKYWQTSHKQEHWPSYKVWHTWSPYSPHFAFADGVF